MRSIQKKHRLKAYSYTKEHLERQRRRQCRDYLVSEPSEAVRHKRDAYNRNTCNSRSDNVEGEDFERGETSRLRHYVSTPVQLLCSPLTKTLKLPNARVANTSGHLASLRFRHKTPHTISRRSPLKQTLPMIISPTPSCEMRNHEWRRSVHNRYAFLTDNHVSPPPIVRLQSVVAMSHHRHTSFACRKESPIRMTRKAIETRWQALYISKYKF